LTRPELNIIEEGVRETEVREGEREGERQRERRLFLVDLQIIYDAIWHLTVVNKLRIPNGQKVKCSAGSGNKYKIF